MSPPYFLFKNCFSDPFLLFVLLLLPWWFPTFQNFFSHQLLLRFVFSQFCPPPPILCRCLRPAPCSKNSPTPNVPCPCAQLSIDSLNTSSVQRKSASSPKKRKDVFYRFSCNTLSLFVCLGIHIMRMIIIMQRLGAIQSRREDFGEYQE